MTDKRNLEKSWKNSARKAGCGRGDQDRPRHARPDENAEYDEAKQNNEARIYGLCLRKWKTRSKTAVFVDDSKMSTDTVAIGHAVKIYDMEYDEEDTYTLVGFTGSRPAKLYISGESPIGRR